MQGLHVLLVSVAALSCSPMTSDCAAEVRVRGEPATVLNGVVERQDRHMLWPRPVIVRSAIERAVKLHRPGPDLRAAIEAAHVRYVRDLGPIEARARVVRTGTPEDQLVRELSEHLFRPPSRNALLFPGIDADEDRGGRAESDDPGWEQMAAAERRILRRSRDVSIRLRALNRQFIGQLDELIAVHEFAAGEAFVGRVLLETCMEGPWSLGHAGLPRPIDAADLLPPARVPAGSPELLVWGELANAMGPTCTLEQLQAAGDRILRRHDTEARGVCLRAIQRLPSGFSGLGGLPSPAEAERARRLVIDRWLMRDHLVSDAISGMLIELAVAGPDPLFVFREHCALARLRRLRGSAETRPMAVLLRAFRPEEMEEGGHEMFDALAGLLSATSARHAERLHELSRDQAVESARSNGLRTARFRTEGERIRRAVDQFEQLASQRLDELSRLVDRDRASDLLRAGSLSVSRRRPGSASAWGTHGVLRRDADRDGAVRIPWVGPEPGRATSGTRDGATGSWGGSAP